MYNLPSRYNTAGFIPPLFSFKSLGLATGCLENKHLFVVSDEIS